MEMASRAQAPSVSVVIPCYDGARFIGEAIASVLEQTFASLELIVVDDGSRDDSVEVVKEYLGDPRARLLRHGENRGIPAARNSGIRTARGRYVAFLDQDDTWKREKLQRQVDILEAMGKMGFGAVFSAVRFEGLAGNLLRTKKRKIPGNFNTLSREEMLHSLYMDNFVPMVSALVEKRCLDRVGLLDESIRSGVDDYEFFLRFLNHYKIYYLSEVLVTRRLHGSNYTDIPSMVPETIEVLGRFSADREELGRLEGARLGGLMTDLGAHYMRNGKMEEAKKWFRRSLEIHPSGIRARLGYINASAGPAGRLLSRLWYSLRS